MVEYKKGKLVQLISGGPNMTTDILVSDNSYPTRGALLNVKGYKDNYIKCTWFEGNTLKYDYFAPEQLIDVDIDDNKSAFIDPAEPADNI